MNAFRSALAEHDQLVCLTLTSKHTTSYEAALVASHVFQTGAGDHDELFSLSIGQGMQVASAYQAAQAGERPESIAAAVKALQKKLKLFIALDRSTTWCGAGGRDHMSVFCAGVLQIRPVLTMLEGNPAGAHARSSCRKAKSNQTCR